MPLIRPSHLSAARAARFTPSTLQIRRPLSSSQAFRSAEGSHEEHYDAPGGWLFGVKPGEKYQNEGWENVFIYGFFGTLAFGVVGYCYKPDTRCVYRVREMSSGTDDSRSIQTWALEEARRRLEAEGILQDPGLRKGDTHANTTE